MTVVATDEGDPGLTGTFDVTVTVTDVEEKGAVTITPSRGWTGTQFSASLEDDDGSLADQTWQWARSTNRSRWTDISGETSSAYIATADDAGNYLRISTEYADSRGSGKTAEAVLTARIADVSRQARNQQRPGVCGYHGDPLHQPGYGSTPVHRRCREGRGTRTAVTCSFIR